MLVTRNILAFNKIISEPLGIPHNLPITLEGKIVCIDLMVVKGPLDLNFLLRKDYVYNMKVVVSTLSHVMYFTHNGNIVTIDQLSFVDLDLTTNHPTSLIVLYLQVISTPPQVNYVATNPMFSITDPSEPLTVYSTSYDLDPVIDIGNLMGC